MATTMAADSGKASAVKNLSCCGTPSSYTLKSFEVRPEIILPALSLTVTGICTKLTLKLIVYRSSRRPDMPLCVVTRCGLASALAWPQAGQGARFSAPAGRYQEIGSAAVVWAEDVRNALLRFGLRGGTIGEGLLANGGQACQPKGADHPFADHSLYPKGQPKHRFLLPLRTVQEPDFALPVPLNCISTNCNAFGAGVRQLRCI